MKFTIRAARLKDYEALLSLMNQGDALHRGHHPDLFREPPDGIARPLAYISGLLEDPNSRLLVAEQDGGLVGALVAQIREAPPHPILAPRRYAVVDNVIVEQHHRGQGIGWALMHAAEEWAKSKDAQSIELNVYLFNEPAICLYESLGYTAISQRMSKPL